MHITFSIPDAFFDAFDISAADALRDGDTLTITYAIQVDPHHNTVATAVAYDAWRPDPAAYRG